MMSLVLVWLAIGVLPGALIARGLRPRDSWLLSLALAPLLSYGVSMAVAVVENAMGLPITAASVLVAVFVIGVVCLGWGYRRQVSSWNVSTTAGIVLSLTVLVNATMWLLATRGLSALPPNDDGSNHGLFATQIARLHTITPNVVVVGDVITGQPNSPYYPLAMHLQAALVSTLSGAPVAAALNLQVLAAVCVLPIGFFLLTRRVFPHCQGAAAIAALFALTFPVMPYFVASWGGYPFIAGICFTAVAVVAITTVEGSVLAESVIAALTLIALFAVHTSELVVALGLVALVMIGGLSRREVTGAALVPFGVGVLTLAVFVGLQWKNIVAGAGNVAVAALIPPQSLVDSLRNVVLYVVTVPEGEVGPSPAWLIVSAMLLWMLAVIGVGVSLRRRWSIEWPIGLGIVMLVTVASSMRLPLIDQLAVPWYSRWDRLAVNEVFFLAPLAALGVAAVSEQFRQRRKVVAGALTAAVAVPAIVTCGQVLETSYSFPAIAESDAQVAFKWISSHQHAGDRVLNEPSDGSSWMWAEQSVAPLFAVAPHQIDGWGDRLYLRDHAAEIASNSRVGTIADQWSVRYAYVGASVFARHNEHVLTVDDYTRLGGWRVVFTHGKVSVLERVS